MIDWRPMVLAGALLGVGCAAHMTPEQKMAHELFVQVAGSCENRYHTIHVDQIDSEGSLKIHADAQESIVPKLFHNATPNPMLQTMVALGRTGLSAGKGFYDWSGCDVESVRRQASIQLAKLLEFLRSGIGPPAPGTRPKAVSK